MTWPQAFVAVGFFASIAACAWAFAWMTVRTESDSAFKFSDPEKFTVDMRPTKKAQR